MKKNIKIRHIIFIIVFGFFIIFVSSKSSFAEDYITLTSNIEKVSNMVTNTFTYKIESDPSNFASSLSSRKNLRCCI